MSIPQQVELSHIPVLIDETVAFLDASKGGTFLDCTFGGGGHTQAILEANQQNFVYAIDCDPAAKLRAQEFSTNHKNFRFYQINFADVSCIQLPQFSGILIDLGVSSFQLDDEKRGFSFKYHVPMDMRLDNSKNQTASEFIKYASERDLVTAIRDYGEEENWRKIVTMILSYRKNDDVIYADTLANKIADCTPAHRRHKIHPATKTFQGIRIFINDELKNIENALPALFDKLLIGGRLAVISFHSLEDRIVKKFFNKMAGKSIDKFDSRPQQERKSYASILTKKPFSPNENEICRNVRSRSAKLRVLAKTHEV